MINEIAPQQALREHEVAITPPEPNDAQLIFIGQISTPYNTLEECPRQGDIDNGPVCTITVFEPWVKALEGIEIYDRIEVLYWFHLSRRDLVKQSPGRRDGSFSTFTLRSPIRPNPIGCSVVQLLDVSGNALRVRGLDCLNSTPLIDIKPEPKPGKCSQNIRHAAHKTD